MHTEQSSITPEQEIACLHAVTRARIRYYQNQIKHIKKERIEGKTIDVKFLREPIIDAFSDTTALLKQGKFLKVLVGFLLFPIVFLVMMLLPPLDWMDQVWHKYRNLFRFKSKLKALIKNPPQQTIPLENKSLLNYWISYGLDELGSDVCARDLLKEWLVIMYGQEVADAVDVEGTYENIVRYQGKAMSDYYRGKTQTHFHFAPIMHSIIGKVDESYHHRLLAANTRPVYRYKYIKPRQY